MAVTNDDVTCTLVSRDECGPGGFVHVAVVVTCATRSPVSCSWVAAQGITETFNKSFTFDKIFGHTSTQKDVFEHCGKQIVDGVLHGFNGSIFAYGQTGSGKTYTMQGACRGCVCRAADGIAARDTFPAWTGECEEDSDQRGIMPRAVQHVFQQFKELAAHGWEYKCTCSFVEIYNETITDLLDQCVSVAQQSCTRACTQSLTQLMWLPRRVLCAETRRPSSSASREPGCSWRAWSSAR